MGLINGSRFIQEQIRGINPCNPWHTEQIPGVTGIQEQIMVVNRDTGINPGINSVYRPNPRFDSNCRIDAVRFSDRSLIDL